MSCQVHSRTRGSSQGLIDAMEGMESGANQTPPKNKGGRRSNATSEARKQRNRQAQAAFRERRTEYIKHLEEEIEVHEDKHRKLQAAHRSATDECLMMRYKNSLLERILLEKGIDVRGELQAKIDAPTLQSPYELQPSVRRKVPVAQRPRSAPKPVEMAHSTVTSPASSTSVPSPASPSSTCSCSCEAHKSHVPSRQQTRMSPPAHILKTATPELYKPSSSGSKNRNGKRSRHHAFYPSPTDEHVPFEQDHDTQTTTTAARDEAAFDRTANKLSPTTATREHISSNHFYSHLPTTKGPSSTKDFQYVPRQVPTPVDEVPGFQSMTQMLQPYDFMLDMEAFGQFSYDSATLTC